MMLVYSHTQWDICRLRPRDWHIARTAGLEINITKTKSMQINASQEAPLTADGRALRKLIASLTWAAL